MKYEKTGVVGLGLIGGSMCRALKKYGEREITFAFPPRLSGCPGGGA